MGATETYWDYKFGETNTNYFFQITFPYYQAMRSTPEWRIQNTEQYLNFKRADKVKEIIEVKEWNDCGRITTCIIYSEFSPIEYFVNNLE